MSFKDEPKPLIPELLFLGTLLAPGLLMFQGRRLLPRSGKVSADTDSHYIANVGDTTQSVVKAYVATLLVVWTALFSGVAPSLRAEISAHFQSTTGLNPREHLTQVLLDGNPDSSSRNFFSQKFTGRKDISVFKAYFTQDVLWNGEGAKPVLSVVTLKPPQQPPQRPS